MKKTLRKIGIAAVLLFVAYTFYFIWAQSQPAPDVYEILKPQVRTIEQTAVATGRVEARNQVDVKPRTTGILSKICVEKGQRVKVGDIIARISIIPDMTAYNNAQSAVKSSRMQLEEVQRETDRIKALFADGVVSREEYEQAINRLDLAKEDYDKALSAKDIVLRGNSAQTGTVNTTVVTATMNGIITSIPLKEGASVVATNAFTDGTTIATIANMNSLRFVGKIDETEVESIQLGMPMSITVGAIHGTTFTGQVEDIATKGVNDNGTIMFEVTGSINATDGGVAISRDGYSANASIVTSRAEKALSVEETAVEYDGEKAFVYKLTSNPGDEEKQKFERNEVELGLSDGIYIQIVKGVAPADLVRGNKKN